MFLCHFVPKKNNNMAIEVTEIYCENAVLVGLITPQQKEAKARAE